MRSFLALVKFIFKFLVDYGAHKPSLPSRTENSSLQSSDTLLSSLPSEEQMC
ncbi:hypothetical protein KC19_8G097400 [Ceratodon purpureus]|uniref:Uncharacterized protein n=1 Tax=Ceratodon purpureus TaxID=3225 RepID=A0A8T0GWX7_CERPU|nr:hypothetical protein KC19_8G097400 [Ceratodon purpureus]